MTDGFSFFLTTAWAISAAAENGIPTAARASVQTRMKSRRSTEDFRVGRCGSPATLRALIHNLLCRTLAAKHPRASAAPHASNASGRSGVRLFSDLEHLHQVGPTRTRRYSAPFTRSDLPP